MKPIFTKCSPAFYVLILSGIVFACWAARLNAFPASWPQAYLDSLTDTSQDATPAKVSKNLIAVIQGEPNLTWDSSGTRVLMETWADDKFYPTKKPGDIITVRSGHPIWVSSPPELKAWVAGHAFPESDLALRLKQMLGMPPEADKTYFAEFWVNTADLVRPSPDPEITDHDADLDFPVNPFIAISDTYKTWFNNLRSISYTTDDAHPWTRLGYTYDWGNQYNHVAISEFVIWDGAQVEINAVTQTASYVAVSPTVIDLGTDTACAGDHLVFNACVTIPSSSESDGEAHPIPTGERRYDVYVLLTAPWGEQMSLLKSGALVEGLYPYASGIPATAGRICQDLLDYTVSDNLSGGVWTVTVAVLPTGAPPTPAHVRSHASATVLIE